MCWRNQCGCGCQNRGCGCGCQNRGCGCGGQNGNDNGSGIGSGQNLRCGWFRICAAPFATPFATTLADTALSLEQEEFGCGCG